MQLELQKWREERHGTFRHWCEGNHQRLIAAVGFDFVSLRLPHGNGTFRIVVKTEEARRKVHQILEEMIRSNVPVDPETLIIDVEPVQQELFPAQ